MTAEITDARYPELLRSIARTLEAELVAQGVPHAAAAQASAAAVERFRREWHDARPYFPLGYSYDRERRNRQLYAERQAGATVAELCRRYGLGRTTVCNALREQRKRS
ncbi:MAG: hypothetical protein IT529_06215 [Burkholderiales bacterium]|nr:hypothetical protein [Burkholderiales bacterium]